MSLRDIAAEGADAVTGLGGDLPGFADFLQGFVVGEIVQSAGREPGENFLRELDKTDGTKYGGGSGEAWCAYFTTWVLKNTKMDDGNSIYSYLRTFGSIDDGAASGLWPAFRNGKEGVSFNKSKAYGGNYTPKKGDVVWFQWAPGMAGCHCRKIYGKWNGSTQCSDHVGIVRAVRDGKVYTTEGNSGNKVSNKEYPIDTEYITAYGSWYK